VSNRFEVPVNAILLTLVFVCFMSLINLGSKVAFEAMTSLATLALIWLCSAQTTPGRDASFGSLVTGSVRTGCECYRHRLYHLVGKCKF
jgi:hypothetical protein